MSRRRAALVPALPALAVLGMLALSSCNGGSAPTSASVRMDTSITSDHCVVTIASGGTALTNSIDARLDYSAASGNFGEARYAARCRSLVPTATYTSAFNLCDESCAQGEHRELTLQTTMGETGDDLMLQTPADLFECLFDGDGATLSRLQGGIHVAGPTGDGSDGTTLDVRVQCDGWPETTTTTSTTTSTLPCDGDGCTSGDVIPLQFWLDDAVTLGALQVNVDFPVTAGAFERFPSGTPKCTLAPGVNALFATNQFQPCPDCAHRLAVGLVFGSGYTGPGHLLTCSFVVGETPPSPGDFAILPIDATSVTYETVDPFPKVSLRGLPGE